jgi:hypothetical protein
MLRVAQSLSDKLRTAETLLPFSSVCHVSGAAGPFWDSHAGGVSDYHIGVVVEPLQPAETGTSVQFQRGVPPGLFAVFILVHSVC